MPKNIISLILAIFVLFHVSGTANAEISKGIKLGLDLATATAEEKSSIEGAKKVAMKELDDWTWNYVVGNYEKLLTQNADAELPGFKEKIGKLKEFIDRVGQVATQLGEGKYDEAAFTAVDQAVATFDHPVVTALWVAVKLTYESHKLVQETKAALQIEALYGKVNNDRLLLGTSSADSPKQIQINSETVDRFFFNYLIKDEGTRELMKPYVQITLGQEWPELPTTDWLKSFTLLGTGLDAQKDYEVEQLTQFRNVSKQWITALLKDINKQAKVDWAATRARQLTVEFDAYASKMKGFTPEQIIESFKKRKEMLRVKKDSPKFLAESSDAYQKLSKEFDSLKPSQVERPREIYSAAAEYHGKADTYSKMALMVDDLPLCNELEKQAILWGKFANTISPSIKANQQKIDDAEVQDWAAKGSWIASELSECYGQFSQVFPSFNFNEEPGSAYEKVRSLLNNGELKAVPDTIESWRGNEYTNRTKTYLSSLIALKKACDSAPTGGSMGSPPQITSFTENSYSYSLTREPGYLVTPHGRNMNYNCSISAMVADEAGWKAYRSFTTLIDIEAGRMIELANAFNSLATQRGEELITLRAALNKIYSKLEVNLDYYDNKPVLERINNKPMAIWEVEEVQKYLKDNTYTFLGNLNLTGFGLVSIDGYMKQKAGDIMGIATTLDESVTILENKYPGIVKKWQEGLDDWSKIEKPDNDAVNQFIVLVDKNFDNDREVLSIDKRAGVIQNFAGMLPGMVKQFAASVKTEVNNRTQDSDYLITMATQWRVWLNMQMENGTFERNDVPTGIPIALDTFDGDLRIKQTDNSHFDFTTGMLIIHKPYYHYASEKELAVLPQLQKARQDLQKFKVYSFVNSNMPFYAAKLESLLSGKNIIPAKEDNFFIQNSQKMVVYKSTLDNVSKMLPGINPEADDFIGRLKEVAALLPGTVTAQTPEEVKAGWENKYGKKNEGKFAESAGMAVIDKSQYAGFEMGKTYLELAEKISLLVIKRNEYLSKKMQKIFDENAASERIKYFTDEIEKMSKEINTLPESSITEDKINGLYTDFFRLRSSYLDLNQKLTGIDDSFKLLEDKILSLKGRFEDIANQKIQRVKDFYFSFRQAYESRNDSQLISFMGDDWEAGDGTTLSDLQDNIRRSFRTFDEIKYNIQNLKIELRPDGKYMASYDVTITSRIYKRNLKHEEKSSVNEEVVIDGSGKPRITRTMNGRFWYVE